MGFVFVKGDSIKFRVLGDSVLEAVDVMFCGSEYQFYEYSATVVVKVNGAVILKEDVNLDIFTGSVTLTFMNLKVPLKDGDDIDFLVCWYRRGSYAVDPPSVYVRLIQRPPGVSYVG